MILTAETRLTLLKLENLRMSALRNVYRIKRSLNKGVYNKTSTLVHWQSMAEKYQSEINQLKSKG